MRGAAQSPLHNPHNQHHPLTEKRNAALTLRNLTQLPPSAPNEILMVRFSLHIPSRPINPTLHTGILQRLDRALVVRAIPLTYECSRAIALEVCNWG
jgi:hypothetical protein